MAAILDVARWLCRRFPVRLANWRNVGISSSASEARNVNSSRASWHWRANALAHHFASLSGSAVRLRRIPLRTQPAGRGCAAPPRVRLAETACGFQILLESSKLDWVGFSGRVHQDT